MPALNMRTRWVLGLLAMAALLAKPAYDYHLARQARAAAQARYAADKAEFQRLCREVAGYKFYRKAENVEGILLLKVRRDGDWQDIMAPGTAFALESKDEGYITSFLAYRRTSSGVQDESYFVSTTKTEDSTSGFAYVDVIDDKTGRRIHYTPRWDEPWQYDKSYSKGYIKFWLDENPPLDPPPRYAVTFEDHVVPTERARGLASGTVKVIDTQTNEVMAEMLRYAWSPPGAFSASATPWLSAYKCPAVSVGSSYATRQFVDRVLIPPGVKPPPMPLLHQ
ncbi:hypothetical protein [Niveibacterium sp.]|uniref:hypothetical protein n=1 Tax=Niveibacterium sp. TaxID=2017444 RepID=UPI0035AFEC75